MKKIRLISLILILCLLLPAAVSASETEAAPSPRIEATCKLAELPAHWNPLKDLTEEARLILRLTASGLYALSPDGSELTPALAESLPQDVTAEFVGQYGIAPGESRGFAFRIRLDPDAKWDDGNPVTTEDFLFTFHQMIDRKQLPVELANLESYYSGAQKASGEILSLRDAGFGSLEEAENAGYSLFYVDTAHFWGLDAGWVSIRDHTRLKDEAIPSGVTEMYVSGAYLYDRYLRTGCDTDVFQQEFVGICAQTDFITREDIGILREDDRTFVLILSRPTTAQTLALGLRDVYPVRESIFAENYATSPKAYRSSGAYRIVSLTDSTVTLEPNPHWLGKTEIFRADLIRLTA